MFNTLYYSYLEALEKHDTTSSIYTNFLNNMDDKYLKTNPKRMVIDYISLMTDTYFLNEYKNLTEKNSQSKWKKQLTFIGHYTIMYEYI